MSEPVRVSYAQRFRGFLPVVVDVETGGFDSDRDALLEIAAVVIRMDAEGWVHPEPAVSTHVVPFPGANIDPRALEITGIDPTHPFRAALDEKGRESMTLTLPEVSAKTVGALIAIFERAVGLYASLVGINAYDQPGVEAGKKAATAVLTLQQKVLDALDGTPRTAEDLAARAGSDDLVTTFKLLQHLAANGRVGRASGSRLTDDAFFLKA